LNPKCYDFGLVPLLFPFLVGLARKKAAPTLVIRSKIVILKLNALCVEKLRVLVAMESGVNFEESGDLELNPLGLTFE